MVSYVESPLDRIVNVNFGTVAAQVNVAWSAVLVEPTSLYEPNGALIMAVSTIGLPILAPSVVVQPPFLSLDPDDFFQQLFGEFPDGRTGTIQAQYFLERELITGTLRGSVFYVSNGAPQPFGGANQVSIVLDLTFPRIVVRDHGLYFQAVAFSGEVSAEIPTELVSLGRKVTATMQIKPSSVSIE
jgi:hypothetical protein